LLIKDFEVRRLFMGSLDFWGRERRDPTSLFEDVWSIFDDLNRSKILRQPRSEHRPTQLTPACDVSETEEGYLLTFDLPGVHRDDISIDVTGRRLEVSGERKWDEETGDVNYYRRERSYGRFLRSFELPDGTNVDTIEASYENGVLKLAVPKAEESKSRKISIAASPGDFLGKVTTKPEMKLASSKN
jgi:HSP20 family protein